MLIHLTLDKRALLFEDLRFRFPCILLRFFPMVMSHFYGLI